MKKTLQILNELVQDRVVEGYVIGGAVASIYYTEPSETSDLDVIVHFPKNQLLISMDPLFEWLQNKGYASFEKEGILIEGIPVQFLPTHNPLSVESYENANLVEFDGVPCRIMKLEYLMANMLEVGGLKYKSRLGMCIQTTDYNSVLLQEIVKKFGLLPKWSKFKEQFLDEDGIQI